MTTAILHPRWITVGTSMGRWASANPNAQNFPARGPMADLRKAVVPRDPSLQLIGGDYSQIEFRRVLHLAGYDPRKIPRDAFTWVVEQAQGDLDQAAAANNMSPRSVAKSVTHAYDYLEGFTIRDPTEILKALAEKDKKKKSRLGEELATGALFVDLSWKYGGGVVAFTGVNLALRLFGAKSFAARAKALEIQEILTKRFPAVREWQKEVTRRIARDGYVQSVTGRRLKLHGTPYERAKYACAFFGQGESADFVQDHSVRLWKERDHVPILQGHDELIYEGPREWDRGRIIEELGQLEEEGCLPGFVCPMKFKQGPNWGEMEEFTRTTI